MMRSVELFTGAGGLAMGISAAGFHHDAMVEWDRDACDTIRENQRRRVRPVAHWPEVYHGDVRRFDYSAIKSGVDLVAGGPPCQPFSLGGKHRAFNDARDMWPESVRAVRELRPRAFIFENVPGLVRESFADYFEHVLLQLTYPEMVRRSGEDWLAHRTRLERHHTSGRERGLGYRVVFQVLTACDFGVPQRRPRVILVGFRNDLNVEWSFPETTHSREALLWDQWASGDYWERHEVARRRRPAMPERVKSILQRLDGEPATRPWRTVRDAIADLPEPREGRETPGVLNHRLMPGARPYVGHTGSPIDEPAKTLKAGDHGVPGGENMLARPDGTVRYFTVRESARLQAFPDDFLFHGSWTESMRQIGNAVPVTLGRVVAQSVADRLAPARRTMSMSRPR